jgi:hypothetical protein
MGLSMASPSEASILEIAVPVTSQGAVTARQTFPHYNNPVNERIALLDLIEATVSNILVQAPGPVVTVPLHVPPLPKPGVIDRWLASHEMLARLFPAWVEFAAPLVDWLWDQRDGQGLWDFGPKPDSIACLPYTDSWRERKNRLIDWTTRVLILLRCYSYMLGKC